MAESEHHDAASGTEHATKVIRRRTFVNQYAIDLASQCGPLGVRCP